MAKRKTFYVQAAIFDGTRSVHAVAVYAYLSFCANKDGECFPGELIIARHCGITRNTVKKALAELVRDGLVQYESAHRLSKNGRMLQCANRYRLLSHPGKAYLSSYDTRPCQTVTPPVSNDDSPRCREMTVSLSPVDREINNNSKTITDDVPSVAVSREKTDDANDVDAILDRLYLHLFEDRVFAEAVEQGIRRMYAAPYCKVDGERIGQSLVRRRLRMLTVDHIDYVEKQIESRGGEITSGDRYLAACLYHAPVDCMVKNARDLNAL